MAQVDDPFINLMDRARKGDPGAQMAVANAYLWGNGVEENAITALSWLRQAAKAGLRAAQVQLADILRLGAEINQEQAREAAAWYLRAALQGDLGAAASLARMYLDGVGVARNHARALTLFQVAGAVSGKEATELLLASDATGGTLETPLDWIREAADQGEAAAQFRLAKAYREGASEDWQTALRMYDQAARQGYAPAQVQLAHLLWDGIYTKQDHSAAVALYEAAAVKGDAEAQVRLAQILWEGTATAPNLSRAIALYRAAAHQGDPDARAALVDLYLSDEDLGVNEPEVLQLLQQIHGMSELEAVGLLGAMLLDREAQSSDHARAQRYIRQAAEGGVASAQSLLGRMYLAGRAVTCDAVLGERWLKRAAEQTDARAALELGRLYLQGAAGVPVNLEAAREQFAAAWRMYPADVALSYLASDVPHRRTAAGDVLRDALFRLWRRDDQRLAEACFKLAESHQAADVVQAIKWFEVTGLLDKGHAELVPQRIDHLVALIVRSPGMSIAAVARFVAETLLEEFGELWRAPERAAYWFRIAAEHGDPQAQLGLSRLLARGYDSASRIEGLSWLSDAAEQGWPDAQTELGRRYAQSAELASQFAQPDAVPNAEYLRWVRVAADQGDRVAQWRLATLILSGKAPGAPDEAIALHRRAAEQGYAPAAVALANMYLAADGVGPDAGEAVRWLKRAGYWGVRNVDDHPEAMLSLAAACMTGDGVERDTAWGALILHRASTDLQDAASKARLGEVLFALGERYRDGVRIESDVVQAIRWFDAALRFGAGKADRCRAEIERLLAAADAAARAPLLRAVADACEADDHCGAFRRRGKYWSMRARAQDGTANDRFMVGWTLLEDRQDEDAVPWIRQAAEEGHRAAQYEMGSLYLAGRGVPANPVEGQRWHDRLKKSGPSPGVDAAP